MIRKTTEHLPAFVACTIVVLLLDLPFRAIGFLGLAPTAGPKNMLPLLLGLLFGSAGCLANGAGLLLSAAARTDFTYAACLEGVLATCVAWLCRSLWYLPASTCAPRIKKLRDLAKFLVLAMGSGCLLGAGLALSPATRHSLTPLATGVQIAGSTLAWSLLAGIPTLITATSVLAVAPVLPRAYRAQATPDLSFRLTPETGLNGVGDAVEKFYRSRGIPPKRGYAIMSCVEEVAVLLLGRLPKGETLAIDLRAGDNILVRFACGGPRYNPLVIRKSGDPDMLGILLVREMAIVTRYTRLRGVNHIKIVV